MGTSVGDHQSATFRTEVADIGNQWAEKSHLFLSFYGLQETRGKLVPPLARAVPHSRHKNTIQSLGVLSSCHHSP